MTVSTKGIRIKKEVWKKLLKIKFDNDLSNMTEVIEHLLKIHNPMQGKHKRINQSLKKYH